MRTNILLTTSLCFAACLLIARAQAQSDKVTMTAASTGGVGTEQITHITATVVAVDQKARTVTLKGPEGNEMTFGVSEEVKRLAEIKPGDQLNVGYLEAIGLEFREPTAEELKEPYKITEQSDKAAKDRAPAGAKLRTVRAVVTVEGMSRWLNALTVKGPRGNYFIVEVEPTMVEWEKLRIGQQMVGTYTETMVMSIEPALKKN